MNLALQAQSAFGLLALIGLAWLLSENRRRVRWRLVAIGLGLQLGAALLFLHAPLVRSAVFSLNALVDVLQQATAAGTRFVFGFIGGGTPPFQVTDPTQMTSLAFQALPLILVMAALSALLCYWGILPLIVRGFAVVMHRTMKVSGPAGLASASMVFLSMVDAPLLIRPWLARLTRAELFLLFTVGLATLAGTVLALYAVILQSAVPDALGHILVASLISLPAAALIAAIMVPETERPSADHLVRLELSYRSSLDALTRGTEDGLRLYLNVVAMLLVAVALVALVNLGLKALPPVFDAPLSVERILGWLFAPLAWLLGIPWSEAANAGALLGTKTILNEFLAYLQLAALPDGELSERSRLIMLYALCGFANLGSVGIMIAGFSSLIPERRAEILQLAPRSLISGTLATCMTGAVIGLLPGV